MNETGIGQGVSRGTRGGRLFGLQVDSHEKTINKGKHEIQQVADRLGIRPREDITGAAHRLYKLAVQRNFTRGRRTQQVAGACLYIVCRQESRPYMLIDFSDVVQTNVYVLGAVFLQLCRLLRLEQHPLISKPIDPSLFIHRFADKLNLGRRMHAVANTALRLVASMKRDWMQTGRRPSGVCGAALWVAALLHGYERSKRDVVAVVHVGEATLRKRVSEFENTPSAQLSIDEFDARAKDLEKEQAQLGDSGATLLLGDASTKTMTCVHKDHEGAAHFAHGMCRMCYVEYARVSGGSRGGEDPPAFQAAEQRREKELNAAAKALPAPEKLLALPAPPETAATGALPLALRGARMRAGKRMTASATAAAIEATLRAANGPPPPKKGASRSDPMLEAEMENALNDRTSHLGEFAVMTGLRSGKGSSAAAAAAAAANVADVAEVAGKKTEIVEASVSGKGTSSEKNGEKEPEGVGPEVAEAAVELLKHLVGEAHANKHCLPLKKDGTARGWVTGKHLSSSHPAAKKDPKGIGGGGRVAGADKTQLHFLIAAGCFDSSAIARLKKYSKHDVARFAATPLPMKAHEIMPPPPSRAPRGGAAAAAAGGGAKGADDVENEEEEEENDEPETFSDVDDDEVAGFIHTAEEVKLRKVIWSELNRDYLETQAAKEAILAAAPKPPPGSEDADGKKKKQRKKYTHATPADTAAEAAQQMLSSKKISSKINYDALNDLFKQDAHQEASEAKAKAKAKAASAEAAAAPAPAAKAKGGGGVGGAAARATAAATATATANANANANANATSNARPTLGGGIRSSRLPSLGEGGLGALSGLGLSRGGAGKRGLGGGGLGSRLAAASGANVVGADAAGGGAAGEAPPASPARKRATPAAGKKPPPASPAKKPAAAPKKPAPAAKEKEPPAAPAPRSTRGRGTAADPGATKAAKMKAKAPPAAPARASKRAKK